LFLSLQVFAQCEQLCIEEGTLIIKINAGQGRIESPLTTKKNIEYNFLPAISYYQQNFFIENTKIGYNLFSNEHITIDAVGKHNRDGVYNYGNEMAAAFFIGGLMDPFQWPDKNTHLSYVGGVETRAYLGSNTFFLGVYDDISNVHHGEEAEFSWGKIWLNNDIKLSTEVGGVYKSAQTLNYYYGSPLNGSRVNYFARLDVAYVLSDDVWLVANYHGEKLSSAIQSSQAVEKQDLHSFFVGITWYLPW